MNIFSKITLRAKLFILVLVPFLVLGLFTFDKISLEKESIAKMESIRMKMDRLEQMSAVTHEFQKERDFAINFLLSPQMDNQLSVEKQVSQTDSIIRNYRTFLSEQQEDTIYLSFFHELKDVRSSLTGFSFGPYEVQKKYNTVIEKFLDIVAEIGDEINTPSTKEEMQAYLSLVQTKENLGKIRNSVNEALIFGMFQRLGYGEFSGYKGAFEYNLNSFIKYSPEELKSRFSMDLEGGTMINTLGMIDNCFEAKTDRITEFTASDWWFSVTGTINVLHELELFVIGRVKDSLRTQEIKLQNDIYSLYGMLFGLLTVILVLLLFTAKSITSALSQIEKAAQQLKNGEIDVNVQIDSKDEIGKLASSFNRMATNNKYLAEVANQIGSGDYNIDILKRSDNDVLGNALIAMRNNLFVKTTELKNKIEELKSANQYKSDFFANMSHELRTPLNSMLILSKLLAANENGTLTPDEVESAEVIFKSGSNLLELINDVLDLSKLEAGKLKVDNHEMDLIQLIEDMNNLFKPVASENRLNFEVIAKGKLPKHIISDAQRIGQILKNLLSNALKFTPSKGLVKLSVQVEKEVLILSVSDTGIGIPVDQQSLIFESFQQADGSTNRKYGGTGLGLSITLNLIRLLQGEIILESAENNGSTFTVKIPIETILGTELIAMKDIVHKVQAGVPSKQSIKAQPKVKQDKKVISSEEITLNEDLAGKKLILIESDISNVFQVSAALMKFNIEVLEAETFFDFKAHLDKNLDFVVINNDSVAQEIISAISAHCEAVGIPVVMVGEGLEVKSVLEVSSLVNKLLELSNV